MNLCKWRDEANSCVVELERVAARRGEQLTVEELQSNPNCAHQVGGALLQVINSDVHGLCARLEHEQECLRRSEMLAAQERANAGAVTAKLRSECEEAKGQIESLRTDGTRR